MKRIFGIVLVLCCFLQSFIFAETTEIKDEYTLEKDAIELLTALEVIDADVSEDLSSDYTRGEFAYILSKLMLPEELSEPKLYFYDVSTDNDYCAAISTLVNLGAVSRAETEFRPEDAISRNEAVKMVMHILGYSVMAEESGGYPTGYLKYAQRCNVLDKVSLSDNLTKSSGLILLYNMLHANVNDVIYNTTGDTKIKSGNGIYMTEVLSIYNTDDILNDNGITSLTKKSDLNDNQYKVGNVLFSTAKDYKNLLGKNVSLYYKNNKSTNKNTAIVVIENENSELTVSAEDIKNGSITRWSYSDADDSFKEKSKSIANNAVYIYNGIAMSSKEMLDNKDTLVPKIGNVRFLDNNNDGTVDVVFVNSYYNIVVSLYDSKTQTIYDKRNTSTVKKSISFENKDYEIKDAEGTAKSFENIIEDMRCLLIGESLAKDFVTVVVSDKVVSGSVMEVRKANGKTSYKIDGGLYSASSEFDEEIQVEKTGKFYINAFNEIIYFDDSQSDAAIFCYVIDCDYSQSFDGKIEIKCYSEDDTERILQVADKVKIDGVTYKKLDESVFSIVKSNIDKIIQVKLNNEGRINVIDTAQTDIDGGSEFGVIPGCENKRLLYEYSNQTIAGVAALTPDTKVFVVPKNGDSDQIRVSDYKILISITGGGNRITLPMTLYRTGDGSVSIAAMIIKVRDTGISLENVNVAGGRTMALVTEISEATNANGDECYELEINVNGTKAVRYTTERDTIKFTHNDNEYKIDKGDLIIFGTNKQEMINTGNVKVIYDRDEDFFNTNEIPLYSTAYSPARNYKKVYAYAKTDYSNFNRVSSVPGDQVVSEDDLYIYNLSDFKTMLLYDSERDIIREATVDDIVYYKDTGNECSKIIFYKEYTKSNGFCIIYR